jgi:hypothetical protein
MHPCIPFSFRPGFLLGHNSNLFELSSILLGLLLSSLDSFRFIQFGFPPIEFRASFGLLPTEFGLLLFAEGGFLFPASFFNLKTVLLLNVRRQGLQLRDKNRVLAGGAGKAMASQLWIVK